MRVPQYSNAELMKLSCHVSLALATIIYVIVHLCVAQGWAVAPRGAEIVALDMTYTSFLAFGKFQGC